GAFWCHHRLLLSWTERKANRGSRLPNFLPQMLKREALRSTVSLFPVLKRAWGNLEFARRQHLGKLVALAPRSQLFRQRLATRDVRHSASYDVRHSDHTLVRQSIHGLFVIVIHIRQ